MIWARRETVFDARARFRELSTLQQQDTQQLQQCWIAGVLAKKRAAQILRAFQAARVVIGDRFCERLF